MTKKNAKKKTTSHVWTTLVVRIALPITMPSRSRADVVQRHLHNHMATQGVTVFEIDPVTPVEIQPTHDAYVTLTPHPVLAPPIKELRLMSEKRARALNVTTQDVIRRFRKEMKQAKANLIEAIRKSS